MIPVAALLALARTTSRVHLAPDTGGVFRVSAEVWVIEYDEDRSGSHITGVATHGRFRQLED